MESVRSVSNLCVHLPRNTEFRQKRWTHDDRSLDLDSLHTSRWSEVFNDTRRAREMQGERETEERESEGYDKWVRRSRSMGRVLFKVLLSWEEGEGKYEKTVFLSILLSLSLSPSYATSLSLFFNFSSSTESRIFLNETPKSSRCSHTTRRIGFSKIRARGVDRVVVRFASDMRVSASGHATHAEFAGNTVQAALAVSVDSSSVSSSETMSIPTEITLSPFRSSSLPRLPSIEISSRSQNCFSSWKNLTICVAKTRDTWIYFHYQTAKVLDSVALA